jgi:hypothetical protein
MRSLCVLLCELGVLRALWVKGWGLQHEVSGALASPLKNEAPEKMKYSGHREGAEDAEAIESTGWYRRASADHGT